jgi:hypothetical protein
VLGGRVACILAPTVGPDGCADGDTGWRLLPGGFESEERAAEAYDVAVLKSKGRQGRLNFDVEQYADLLECIDNVSLEELIMIVRRQSQAFSRGTSVYRGVTRHPRCPQRKAGPFGSPATTLSSQLAADRQTCGRAGRQAGEKKERSC